MNYRRGETTTAKLNRAFPYKVDIPSPRGGLGRVEIDMRAWCREHGEWESRPHEVREYGQSPVQCLRFFFKDGDTAKAFNAKFGGTLSEPKR